MEILIIANYDENLYSKFMLQKFCVLLGTLSVSLPCIYSFIGSIKGNSSEKLPPTFIAPNHSPNST